ncbi:MAG: sodium:solute symporter [Calditrichia bacterium]
MSLSISIYDTLIIFGYFALILTIGAYFARKGKNSTEYFLAGRNVGWMAVGASLFASNISGEHFIGLAGSGASSGLAVGHFEWLASIIVLFLGWIFVPFYLKSGVFTMPEFLEKRFNRASRMYLTSVSLVAYILTKISVTLFAGGLLLNKILGLDMVTSAVMLVIITGLYTIAGGLGAVIYTELVQAVVLIGGSALLTFLGLKEVGGFSGLEAKLPHEFFSMFKPMSDPDFPWTGILFGAPILGIWYWCTDQFIVQRVLSAKNIHHARSGAIFAGFLKVLPVFILVLPGLIAIVLFPEISGDEAFPTLVTSHLLPVGIKGIVIAGLLAAVMSSLASCFNSSSTLFTMDFYRHFRPLANERELVLVGRLATAVMVMLGIMWVPLIHSISSQLFIYLQSVQAYISPPIAAVFILGVLWKRVNGRGAIYALITGAIIGGLRLALEIMFKKSGFSLPGMDWFVQMNFLHFALFLFIISVAVLTLLSLQDEQPPAEKIAGLTISGSRLQQSALNMAVGTENPWWMRINIALSVALVSLIILICIIFF